MVRRFPRFRSRLIPSLVTPEINTYFLNIAEQFTVNMTLAESEALNFIWVQYAVVNKVDALLYSSNWTEIIGMIVWCKGEFCLFS